MPELGSRPKQGYTETPSNFRLMEALYRELEDCLERLPESAAEAVPIIRRILSELDKNSYSGQMGSVMISYLEGILPDCKVELRKWLAELREPGLYRRYNLPGAPRPG